MCLLSAQMIFALQETEAEDRMAVAEAMGDVAANLAAQAAGPLPGDAAANPLLRQCFEGMADVRLAVQDCAAAALAQVRASDLL